MTSFFSVLNFVKTYLWILFNRPNEKEIIISLKNIIDSGFICYDYEHILEMAKHDKELYERLKKSYICS